MAYTDDWESLMNGVFGAGGKLKFGGAQPQPEKPQPEKPAGSGLPDLNAALLEQQKQLDEMLKQQNARLKAQDAGVQTALEDSRQMLRDMEADGLLAKGTADTKPEQLGSFEGLAAEVKKTVLGQDAFVDSVVRAMRRPFVLGTEGAAARNVILLWGAPGTGRHFALAETARIMAARGLLQSDRMAVMDLTLYPDPGAEKLFLQDLYAALHAPGEIVVFEHYESCHPGFLRILSDLAVKGSAPLSSRYLVNKEGILVEAGTALAPGAVSRIDPCGKYLIFFSRKGREALADKFGASFVAAVGDVCQTAPFTPEALAALAAQQLNALAQRVHSRLGLTLTAGAEVRDYVAAQCSKEKGAEGLADCCERIFRALSEYCLQTEAVRHGGADRRARGAAICAERCRPGRPVQPAAGGLHRRGGADPRRTGCAGGACPGQGVCVRSGRQFTGAAAPRGGGLQDRKPVHAHDLYRQPRHRQDHHCPAGGKVPQGHRRTGGRAAGGGDPRRPCGALHRAHRPADQQRHRERTGGRFVH